MARLEVFTSVNNLVLLSGFSSILQSCTQHSTAGNLMSFRHDPYAKSVLILIRFIGAPKISIILKPVDNC